MSMSDLKDILDKNFGPEFYTLDPDDLKNYGRDWTKAYTPNPTAIVFPKTTDEVARFLKIVHDHNWAIVPSGGRTGLAGGAVAPNQEIVLSLKKMNQISEPDLKAFTLHVQAGAITQAVHEKCAPFGLTWPVDFASKGSSTVGGNLSTNAGGVRVIRYGLTRNWVLGLKVALMNGTVMNLNGALEKNNTGLDLRQMFISTEGTLGVICEATLKLCRLPGESQVFLFSVKNFATVLELFKAARVGPFTLSAFETFSDACLSAVIENRRLPQPFQSQSEAYVLMEVEPPLNADPEILENWLSGLFEKELILDGRLASNAKEIEHFWAYREGISESVMTLGYNHKNDIALPIAELESFVADFIPFMEREYPEFRVFLFGHIGDGNLHINILKPDSLSLDMFLKRTHDVDRGLFTLVNKYKGSISAEHGIGLLKKEALSYSRTPEEIAILHQIKQVFDPKGLLNPGKII